MKSRATLVLALSTLAACSMPPPNPDGGKDAASNHIASDVVATDAGAINATTQDTGLIDSGPHPVCPPPGRPGPNATTPGAITAPNPTIRNLTLEWAITGDSNNNGMVNVRYRPVGTPMWRAGMPLRNVPAGGVSSAVAWAHRHSGSVFDLEPDTVYEIELYLLDPDGGCEVRTQRARTRAVPTIPSNGTVRMVNPSTFSAAANSSNPGDIITMEAGNYPAFTISRDGTPGRPIVFRSTAGAVVIGNIDLFNRHDVHIEGLTIQGRVRFNNGRNIAVVRNHIRTTTDGVVSLLRSEDCYVADNTITGMSRWEEAALGVSGSNAGEGIAVTGPGHVIEHNRVTGFRDGISFLEGGNAIDQWSIDVVENDIDNAGDDGIEADFCRHNCRIVRNRLTNVFMAMSSQPSLGGPTYFIRNAAYNVVHSTFKLLRRSVGDVLLHNTSVKNGDAFGVYTTEPVARSLSRNNLFLGGPGGEYNTYKNGTGQWIAVSTAQPTCDWNYDGFGSTTGTATGRYGSVRFNSLAELRRMTTERNAVGVDFTVFAGIVAYPASPFPARSAPDLRLRTDGPAVDAGERIANVNDGFVGNAPDLGAFELGTSVPLYGPR